MPVWSTKRFINDMPPNGVTGLSEYSMGRFTIIVIVPHASIPLVNNVLPPLLCFYRMVRYFTDGVALGSKEFVEELFVSQRDRFSPKRRLGGQRMVESEAPFYTLRRLRVSPLG